MKIYHWTVLIALAFCLGCGSGESEKPNSGADVTSQAGKSNGGSGTTTSHGTTGSDKLGQIGRQAKDPSSARANLSGMTAEKVLDKMVAAYKNATSYSDRGRIHLTAKTTRGDNIQPIDIKFPMSMSLEKPNKFLIVANEGTARCDGTTFYEYVEPFPKQILKKPAPEKISIEAIFSEPILADAMAQGPTRYYTWIPIQAVLLLADDPLKTLLYNVERMELLESVAFEGRKCYRVRIHRHDGSAIFWIDVKSFVLRRFEYPLGGIRRDFQNGQSTDLKVAADFRDATLNTKVDEKLFTFEPPKKIQLVTMLAPLQIKMLGKRAPDFFFDGVDVKPVTLKSLEGKTIVIDFWTARNMPSRYSLSLMSQITDKFRDDDPIVFLVCNIDRFGVKNEDLKKVMKEINVSLPLYRDLKGIAREQFHVIPGISTIVVIGPKGLVQRSQNLFPRYDGLYKAIDELQKAIRATMQGKKVFKEQLSIFESPLAVYKQIFDRMLDEDLFIDPQSIMQMIPIAGVASKSDPKRAKLNKLWNCRSLGVPGNILVLDDSQPPRILVCHDSRFVAELDTAGKVIKDYSFSIPADAAITNIRAGKTATGQRFYVGFAPSLKQFFFLDEEFNVKWAFPTSVKQGAPQGIADVRIADLTGDETPEIVVGYRGKAGIQAVSLDGKVVWSNRNVTGVTKMAVAPKTANSPGLLFSTTDISSLVGLDGQGKVVKKIDLGYRRFNWIASKPLNASGQANLCGLSPPDIGKNEAIGISREGDLMWKYTLPDGTPGTIINRVVSGRPYNLQEDQWILLGVDSSIHIISESGRPVDSFNYGEFVTGIATATIGGKQTILISSSKGVEAVTLEPLQ